MGGAQLAPTLAHCSLAGHLSALWGQEHPAPRGGPSSARWLFPLDTLTPVSTLTTEAFKIEEQLFLKNTEARSTVTERATHRKHPHLRESERQECPGSTLGWSDLLSGLGAFPQRT